MKMEKDTNIMQGKGEWDESEHPRDEDGKFTNKGGGTSHEKEVAVSHLIDTLKQIKKIKTKELVKLIMSFPAVELETDDKTILAEFDRFSAGKNVYGTGRSDNEGFKFKIENPEQIPKIIKDTKYSYSKEEIGKNTPQHKGVKTWHYFTGEFETEKGVFKVVVNVRDKGDKQYIYEVAIKKKA